MIYTVTLNPAVDRELTVPAIAFDRVLRATAWRVDLGGKGFNVARQLAAVGTPSVALAFAGGASGEMLRSGLSDLGIETDFVTVAGDTRTNVSIVESDDDRYVKVNEPGPTIDAAEQNQLLSRVRERAVEGDWWVLAGSLPPGVPPEFYARLINAVQEKGARAIFDASGPGLHAGCAAGPFLVKPNAEEAAALTGLPVATAENVVAAGRRIQRLGPKNVLISRGEAGAFLLAGESAWRGKGPVLGGGNPIGAGDAMVAGVVWRLSEGASFEEALWWGMACGAATAAQSGTAVGQSGDVKAAAATITIGAWTPDATGAPDKR